jgi:prepilin-type N-terminal cleavage/methylation domain-containing protein
MQKPRRYERIFLVADVEVQPNTRRPPRLPARMFNVSKAGAAVFSKHHFAIGEIVGVEMSLPAGAGRRARTFMVYGIVRHVEVQSAGNVLGIEFVVSGDAGDYESFEQYMDEHAADAQAGLRRGFTLIEVCIAMTVICILVTMAIPLYARAVEQARVDVASARLRTLWSAQRVYWLEHRTFTTSFSDLEAMDVLGPSLAQSQSAPDAVFVYQMVTADADSFLARAMRNGSGSWVGQLLISDSGEVTGQINGPGGQTILPVP